MWLKLIQKLLQIISSVILALGLFPNAASANQNIQSPQNVALPYHSSPTSQLARIYFDLPPKGAPGGRDNGSTRDPSCPKLVDQKLTALTPATNIGLTISERPTFWLFIPYQTMPTSYVKLELEDEQNNVKYQQSLQLNKTPGIVKITLPANSPPLEVDKPYHWILTFVCNPENNKEDLAVNGYVQRIPLEPNISQQLDAVKNIRERVMIYAENGVWFDALNELANARISNPDNELINTDWAELLGAVQLKELATQPLIN